MRSVVDVNAQTTTISRATSNCASGRARVPSSIATVARSRPPRPPAPVRPGGDQSRRRWRAGGRDVVQPAPRSGVPAGGRQLGRLRPLARKSRHSSASGHVQAGVQALEGGRGGDDDVTLAARGSRGGRGAGRALARRPGSRRRRERERAAEPVVDGVRSGCRAAPAPRPWRSSRSQRRRRS